MKKYTIYKTIQLVIFILVSFIIIHWIFPNLDIYHLVAMNSTVKLLAICTWLVLLLSLIFLFLDYAFFFKQMKDYSLLDKAVHSDPLSGIANRLSCDILIESYYDQPLPDNIGAVMFNLESVKQINELYGHEKGNLAIRDFSNILILSADEQCFVGRNGGNTFLAIFETCTEKDIKDFLDRVSSRVNSHNNDFNNSPLVYKYGMAFQQKDNVQNITELISLACSRIYS